MTFSALVPRARKVGTTSPDHRLYRGLANISHVIQPKKLPAKDLRLQSMNLRFLMKIAQ